MEFEQQQFEDFFSGPKKIRVKGGGESAASLCQRRSHWCLCGGGGRRGGVILLPPLNRADCYFSEAC
jgi:hypothetical protein